MANKLSECVAELHRNHTGREECPNLGFMDFMELETLLEHAKTRRHKSDGQEPAQPERGPDEADGKPQGAEGLFRKRMLAYAHMIARNRRDETEALLSALADEPLEAKYKDYWDCWGDEEPEGGETI